MNKNFYSRLAFTNIRNNKSIYLPYLMAGTLVVMLFYSLKSVAFMITVSGAKGGSSMGMILTMSSWLCGFFSLIILFYINSFIMKRRKKEFGLYSILGMEKRHISIVMVWEVLISALSCILLGILLGALFSQLLFLLLLRIVGLPVAMTFQIPFHDVFLTVLIFGAGFLLLLIYDVIKIARTDPIALLRSAKEGEREPKSKLLLALIGLLALGAGYVMSWTVKTASDALSVFFPAVLLVIIGTYCIFIAGSIVLLKILRKNKNFYYKPKNFISVSGMMYRMKQNATGLANICILSTCVLVTLSSTVCLFIGEEDILREQYPRDVKTSCIMTDENSGEILKQAASTHADTYDIAIENAVGYANFSYPAIRTDDEFKASDLYDNNTYEIRVILLSDYQKMTGESLELQKGEALVASNRTHHLGDTITLDGLVYHIKKEVELPESVDRIDVGLGMMIVLPEFLDLEKLQTQVNSANEYTLNIMYFYEHDISGSNRDIYYETMRDGLLENVDHLAAVSTIDSARNDFYQLYGSLLFVGIFFVTLFLIAAVLIIYYKQITEGFDDHDRFRIMQNVGMSDREVRATINKQVLLIFFIPLGMAVLHIIVAFPVLCKLLLAFNMNNRTLFFICTVCSILAFSLFYFFIYRLTSKTYYRIVQSN